MMKKFYFTCCFVLFSVLFAPFSFAQNIETIYMKNGSVINGYIAEQSLGNYIRIHSERATIAVGADSLKGRSFEYVPYENLSENWKEWSSKNGRVVIKDEVECLKLATLEFPDTFYENVCVVEEGAVIKFVDLSEKTFTFKWGELYRIEKSPRSEGDAIGLTETLVLNNGESVEGQIIDQIPGDYLKLLTKENEVFSYRYSQIKKIITTQYNSKVDLWTQIRLLDRILIKGEDYFLEGFISSRTMNKEIVFVFENGMRRTISLKDIAKLEKIPNEKYEDIKDVVLEEGEVLLNGAPAYFAQLESKDQYLLLGEMVSAQVKAGESVRIQARFNNLATQFILVQAHIEEVIVPDGQEGKCIYWPVITYQDMVQSPLPMERKISPLGNIDVTFVAKETGDYVLRIDGVQGYIVVNVI